VAEELAQGAPDQANAHETRGLNWREKARSSSGGYMSAADRVKHTTWKVIEENRGIVEDKGVK
jgi:hypothetical protein